MGGHVHNICTNSEPKRTGAPFDLHTSVLALCIAGWGEKREYDARLHSFLASNGVDIPACRG